MKKMFLLSVLTFLCLLNVSSNLNAAQNNKLEGLKDPMLAQCISESYNAPAIVVYEDGYNGTYSEVSTDWEEFSKSEDYNHVEGYKFDQVQSSTSLNCSEKGITNIEGISMYVDVKILVLNDNEIENANEIKDIKSLTNASIDGNPISDKSEIEDYLKPQNAVNTASNLTETVKPETTVATEKAKKQFKFLSGKNIILLAAAIISAVRLVRYYKRKNK